MLILEAVINRYLALDPEMLEKIAVFSGKVIKLEIIGLRRTGYTNLFLFPGDGGLQTSTEFEGEPDTILRGSPLSIFKMGTGSKVADLLLKGELEIIGDSRLGHQFNSLFSRMDIDWSEPLAAILGDAIAYQLQQSGQNASLWTKQAVDSVSMTVSEYLQEESRDVVPEAELQIFNDSVDQLRDDVDRLQAKINNIFTASLSITTPTEK